MTDAAKAQVLFPKPRRLIAVGDLNGDDVALQILLARLDLVDDAGAWAGHEDHLVVLGDVINRGTHARDALERIFRLQDQARQKGGAVTLMLGNHEAMTLMGHHGFAAAEEFLSFAADDDRAAFEAARQRRMQALLHEHHVDGMILPMLGAMAAWDDENAPGRDVYRKELSADGYLGARLRQCPLAIRVGRILLVHGGLLPQFVPSGLEALDDERAQIWANDPQTSMDVMPDNLLVRDDGPLWFRGFASFPKETHEELLKTLELTHTKAMVVGHTRTDIVGGELSVPLALHDGRLYLTDVGMGSGGMPTALVFEDNDVHAFGADRGLYALGQLKPVPGRSR